MSKQPYTFTVLRYVHDTSTGEFANVCVVLTSPDASYADAILRPTYGRLSKMFPGFDGEHFRRVIRHLQTRFAELSAQVREEMNLGERPTNALGLAHRVIAADDSSFQWSTMGGGLAGDLPATLEKIYQRMVELYDEKAKPDSRNADAVWRVFTHVLGMNFEFSLEPYGLMGDSGFPEGGYEGWLGAVARWSRISRISGVGSVICWKTAPPTLTWLRRWLLRVSMTPSSVRARSLA
jgi:hypothetical protein